MLILQGFADLITDFVLHNYGLGIAQLRTSHCEITDFVSHNYGLLIAEKNEITDINHCKTIISAIIQKGGILWLFVEVN